MAADPLDYSGSYIDPTYLDSSSADLSTEYANPEIYSMSSGVSAADTFGQIANVAGQWGATIASVVSGNPVATIQTPGGSVQTIGAAGSYVARPTMLTGSSGLLILLAAGVVLFLLLRD